VVRNGVRLSVMKIVTVLRGQLEVASRDYLHYQVFRLESMFEAG